MQDRGPGCLSRIFAAFASLSSETVERVSYPYRSKSRFLSPNEAAVFNLLEHINEDWVVFANVLLRDVIEVTERESSKRTSAFNKIAQRQVDFVICDRSTMRPVIALELDDTTHDRQRRQASDAFETAALKAAGVPLLRIRGRQERTQLLDAIQRLLTPKS